MAHALPRAIGARTLADALIVVRLERCFNLVADAMTLASLLIGRMVRLPPAHTLNVLVDRDLRVPMPDGTVLLADRYAPRGAQRLPLVLLRSPYDRHNLWGMFGRLFAERGYQAVVQSTRGTFGSTGAFEPFHHEAADGMATLDWLQHQPWCGDRIALFGPSYLGQVQWALAARMPSVVKALAVQISASQFYQSTYPGGSFSLDTTLSWAYQVHHQAEPPLKMLAASVSSRRVLARAFARLPLAETDRAAVGRPVGFYQTWLSAPARKFRYLSTTSVNKRTD
jgi:putative CocE/NonD family hydrolase